MKLIDNNMLDALCQRANESPRGRMNLNFHEKLDAPAQRLLNAMQPGTEFPIHRHTNTNETYFVLRGRIRVDIYDNNKVKTESAILDPKEGVYGGHILAGQWHTLEVLEKDTVLFEVKDGPYIPISPENILQ